MNNTLLSFAFMALAGWAGRTQAQSCPNPIKIGNDLRITYAVGNRAEPSLAWFSTINEYGLIWTDYRDSDEEIYFARLSSMASNISSNVRITNSYGISRVPSLSWGGSEYGLSWVDERDSNLEIYFARISYIGNKIGNDVRVTNNNYESYSPSIVWTGSNYGISWRDLRNDSNGLCDVPEGSDCNNEIYFARISASGSKIGSDVRITNNIYDSYTPSLAWAGIEYGVSWGDDRDSNSEIYFARISWGGAKIGNDIRVTSNPGSDGLPSLVWSDSEYGLSWESSRDGNPEIYFARISAGGAKIGSDIRITNAAGTSSSPSLVWIGSEYGVSWRDERDGNREIYFARISAAGSKNGIDFRITNNSASSYDPSLVWTESEYGVAWYDNRDGNYEIYFARIGCDNDGDGLDNVWEETYGCMQASTVDHLADYDSDGLNNQQEYAANTNPCDPDTDHDLALDGAEVNTYFTDPLNPDTDGDLMFDGWEIGYLSCLEPLAADGATDFDGDGLANVHECYNDLSLDGNLSDPCDATQPKRGAAGGGYFGDADGDLVIGVPDLNIINLRLNGRSYSYSNVYPADPIILDLDGDLVIGEPDKNLLSLILNGRGTDFIEGSPTELTLVDPASPPTKQVGDTVRIKVKLTKDLTKQRAGFGVVFTIVSGSGTLLGGEGVSGPGRYDLTALDGVAQMVVKVTGSGAPIRVQVNLPYDAEVHTRAVTGPEVQINVGP